MMDDNDAITVPVDPEVKDKANAVLREYGTDVAGFVRDIVVDIAAMDALEHSRGSRHRILRSPLYSKDWKTGAKILIGHCGVTFFKTRNISH